MRLERRLMIWTAGGLAGGVIAVSAHAQTPLPPTGPAPCVPCERQGPLRRAWTHTFRVLQDQFIGYPSEFVEPPVGFYVHEYANVQRAKADPHRFTLYRSDFLDGSDRLSPSGASRFNLMAPRLASWPGPVVIEWSPDLPGLAEARRSSVLAYMRQAGVAVVPERVVIGPSPYPGLFGTDAAQNHETMISRDAMAPRTYSLSPAAAGTFNTGGGGAP